MGSTVRRSACSAERVEASRSPRIQEEVIATETATESRTEFTDQAESRLDELAKEFQEMELEQMRKGEMSARKKLEKAKKWVTSTRNEYEQKLRKARKASDAAWDDVREGVTEARSALEEAIDRARREFAGEDTTAEKDEEKD